MNNNIKKESLDLEAMMNHLDQKAEKKKEFNSELESLNEMLNMLGVELLTVKDGLQQIENTPVRDKKVFKKFGNHKDFLYLYI